MRGSAVQRMSKDVPRRAGLSEADKNILVAAQGGGISLGGQPELARLGQR